MMVVDIKLFVVLFVAAVAFGPPLGVEALICKCTESAGPFVCTKGKMDCSALGTSKPVMCKKSTSNVKPKRRSGQVALPAAGNNATQDPEGRQVGNANTGVVMCANDKDMSVGCKKQTSREGDVENCYCNTDNCDPKPGSSPQILRCHSWFLFVAISSVFIVPTFVGGQ